MSDDINNGGLHPALAPYEQRSAVTCADRHAPGGTAWHVCNPKRMCGTRVAGRWQGGQPHRRFYGMDTFAVYRSSWCSAPSGLLPVLFELSDQAGQNVPPTKAACV
jgi:hypothetical protein